MTDKRARINKLTRDDLRSIEMGKTKTFALPDARACDNGKSLTYQTQNLMGCKFSVKTDYVASTLTITRNAI
ncbi:MAG: hypothetical protein MSG77_06095 [Prevotella sp.]|nr:hypothetical protein [Prevotella sp.]